MSFSNWQDFLEMGGYAAYVWAAYGLSLAVLAASIAGPLLRQRRLLRELDRRERRRHRNQKG